MSGVYTYETVKGKTEWKHNGKIVDANSVPADATIKQGHPKKVSPPKKLIVLPPPPKPASPKAASPKSSSKKSPSKAASPKRSPSKKASPVHGKKNRVETPEMTKMRGRKNRYKIMVEVLSSELKERLGEDGFNQLLTSKKVQAEKCKLVKEYKKQGKPVFPATNC